MSQQHQSNIRSHGLWVEGRGSRAVIPGVPVGWIDQLRRHLTSCGLASRVSGGGGTPAAAPDEVGDPDDDCDHATRALVVDVGTERLLKVQRILNGWPAPRK